MTIKSYRDLLDKTLDQSYLIRMAFNYQVVNNTVFKCYFAVVRNLSNHKIIDEFIINCFRMIDRCYFHLFDDFSV